MFPITKSQRKLCTDDSKLMFVLLHFSDNETHQKSKERQMFNSILFKISHNHSFTDFNTC